MNNVIEIVMRETGAKYVTESTPLDDLGMDSLEFIDLIVTVQATTGKEIKQADYGTLQTVGDLVKAIE